MSTVFKQLHQNQLLDVWNIGSGSLLCQQSCQE